MSIIVSADQVREILEGEIPGIGEEAATRIIHRMSLASGSFEEIEYRGHIGADLMVNCADVCIVGELHSVNRKLRIFVENGEKGKPAPLGR